MLNEIKSFIKKCPCLKGKSVKANYLSEKPMTYSVEAVPCTPVIKEYVDGGSLRQYIFVFASRELYDGEEIENIKTAQFYEDFAAWLEECSKNKNLPDIPEGKSHKIEILSFGYLYESDARYARFQMQLRLVYRKQ